MLGNNFMDSTLNSGKNSACIGMSGTVNKPRPQELIYPGYSSVHIGIGKMVRKPSIGSDLSQSHTTQFGVKWC